MTIEVFIFKFWKENVERRKKDDEPESPTLYFTYQS